MAYLQLWLRGTHGQHGCCMTSHSTRNQLDARPTMGKRGLGFTVQIKHSVALARECAFAYASIVTN